ncbi:MAG: crossover junction endodeoxyribonuclease RuvC [Alphaproteobacteria bacterium]
MRLIGLDPGLRSTGWGVIEVDGNRLRHLGNGAIATKSGAETASRLAQLFEGIMSVIDDYQPDEAAVEETFVNRNPQSALKLGLARGVVLLAPARAGLRIAEYAPNQIKKAVVGSGHAAKEQVALMVAILLPGAAPESSDAADALAVAICHSHRAVTAGRWVRPGAGDGSTIAEGRR